MSKCYPAVNIESALTPETMHSRGLSFRLQGNLTIAQCCYKKAFELSCETYGMYSLETAKHANHLAAVCFSIGDYEDCHDLLRITARIYEASFVENHLNIQIVNLALALTSAMMKEYEDATYHYEKTSLKDYISGWSQDVSYTSHLPRLAAIAAIKYEQGRFVESFELLRFAILSETEPWCLSNNTIANLLSEISVLRCSQGATAEGRYLKEMSARMKVSGPQTFCLF